MPPAAPASRVVPAALAVLVVAVALVGLGTLWVAFGFAFGAPGRWAVVLLGVAALAWGGFALRRHRV